MCMYRVRLDPNGHRPFPIAASNEEGLAGGCVRFPAWPYTATPTLTLPTYIQEGKTRLVGALVAGTAVAGGVAVCSADHVPSIDYGWSHHGLLASYDYAAYV